MDGHELLMRIGPLAGEASGPVRSAQLAAAIADAIADGRLPRGTSLPAERSLAAVLQVSRGTVARTYDRLRDGDLVHTRHGAGTSVGSAHEQGPTGAAVAALRSDSIVAAAGHRDRTMIDLRIAAWDGDDVLAACLQPDPAALRRAVVGQDGYWPEGLPDLREAVARHLARHGLPTEASQLVITSGAQQAIDVVLSTVTRPGDPLLLEHTTWSGVLELATVRHLRPLAIPQVANDHIPLLRALRERRADLAYLVPSFHNPTAAVLPAPARRLVVEAAAAGGATVLDDATVAELWIDEPPPRPLAAAYPGAGEHVITIGGLSKAVWGGLRLGWLRAEEPVIRQLARTKAALDIGNPVVAELAGLRVLERFDDLAEQRRTELRRRRDAFVDALTTHLPDWQVEAPGGGLSLWVDLGGVDSDAVVTRARRFGVRVPPARSHVVDGRDPGHLRLTLSRPAEELVVAAERLADAWASLQVRPEPTSTSAL